MCAHEILSVVRGVGSRRFRHWPLLQMQQSWKTGQCETAVGRVEAKTLAKVEGSDDGDVPLVWRP